MNFPLTDSLIEEANTYNLRSSCQHCFFYVEKRCAHEWPDLGQSYWPLGSAAADREVPSTVEFCKEFELL